MIDAGITRGATASLLPTATPADARARIWALMRERRGAIAVVLTLTATASAASLAGPALIGRVVNALTGDDPNPRATLDRTVIVYAFLVVVAASLTYVAAVTAARVAEGALAELRSDVFEHAVDLPVDLVEQVGTGELVSRVIGDVQTLTDFTRRALPRIVFAGAEALLTVVALVVVDIRLAAVAIVVAVPIGALGGRWYLRHAPRRYRAERERAAALTTRIHETYRGAPVLRAYRAVHHHRRRIVDAGRANVEANMDTTAARNRFRSTLQAAQGAALVAVLVTGVVLVRDDRLALGAVSAAALYLVRLIDPVTVVIEQVDALQRATASLARIVGLTQVAAPTMSSTAPRAPLPTADDIAVDIVDLTFGYRPDRPVLHGINMRVRRGERVVIVGASGAGKTTLAKLLTRAQHPTAGHIHINGRQLDDYHADEIPRVVALVVQEGHIFGRSVADNLHVANPALSVDRMRDVLEAVDAIGWVDDLPRGSDTIVGEGHHLLTPPQQQQLALARLLAADPDIVILDEATADLDPIAAARTERHLGTALVGRTVITIAHRLTNAPAADRVILVDKGHLVAAGTHRELLATNAAYQQLWDHWRNRPTARPGTPTATPAVRG